MYFHISIKCVDNFAICKNNNNNNNGQFMLGNVAHDLRTPLQAFQSELELLRGNIKDESTGDKSSLFDSIIQLERICHFMNMTINRSIDFTKASSGIKLNPSIESTNIAETLHWAVGCMMTSDTNVPIVIAPISNTIYNQIYTDKQWFMENMLCLLSNAQKFTTEGDITIRCSLHSAFQEDTVVQKHTTFGSDAKEDNIEIDTSLIYTSTETAMPKMLIEVEDTGIGISSQNQELLFKPFAQVFYFI
jgi:two-component system sensor histidine kinase/response regulator